MAGQLTAYSAAPPCDGVNNSVKDNMADALREKSKTWTRNLGCGQWKLTSGNTEVQVGVSINHLPKHRGSSDSRLRKWNPMTVPYEYP